MADTGISLPNENVLRVFGEGTEIIIPGSWDVFMVDLLFAAARQEDLLYVHPKCIPCHKDCQGLSHMQWRFKLSGQLRLLKEPP